MALNATIGVVIFKLSGENFRQIVPADYTSLGPFAKNTMPLKYPRATTRGERSFVQGEQCHTCGSWEPNMYADHVGPRGSLIAPQCPNCSCTQGGYVRQGKNTTLPNHIGQEGGGMDHGFHIGRFGMGRKIQNETNH